MKYPSNFTNKGVKDLLEELYDKYNRKSFIEKDPIAVPHCFSLKEDIEISGFLTATISWGQRKQILKSAFQLMEMMDNSPHDFVMKASAYEMNRLNTFYYRTFQSTDLLFFLRVLKYIYCSLDGLEGIFTKSYRISGSVAPGLIELYNIFRNVRHEPRSMKHIANILKGSSAKRLNMFLRWMVRKDIRGVDFGLWKYISPSALYIPLDVHSGRTARELGLLVRKQNDWKAVEELTILLREFDKGDPVKYDFALFGSGIEKIS